MREDREGNLWVGTYGGVSRYDGATFATLTTEDGLAYDVVSSIAEDREGDLWIGTDRGLSRYDGRGFRHFDLHDPNSADQVNKRWVDRERWLWLGTEESGLDRHRGGAAAASSRIADGGGRGPVGEVLGRRAGGPAGVGRRRHHALIQE